MKGWGNRWSVFGWWPYWHLLPKGYTPFSFFGASNYLPVGLGMHVGRFVIGVSYQDPILRAYYHKLTKVKSETLRSP